MFMSMLNVNTVLVLGPAKVGVSID